MMRAVHHDSDRLEGQDVFAMTFAQMRPGLRYDLSADARVKGDNLKTGRVESGAMQKAIQEYLVRQHRVSVIHEVVPVLIELLQRTGELGDGVGVCLSRQILRCQAEPADGSSFYLRGGLDERNWGDPCMSEECVADGRSGFKLEAEAFSDRSKLRRIELG